ncbi:hypothetical protein VIBNISFn135_200036 [Vibrio nigripulchritudo SFn135]|nr:hypothetical protein VIBNISFn135_200036 [Vibrio nigripulchritudo SFn135]
MVVRSHILLLDSSSRRPTHFPSKALETAKSGSLGNLGNESGLLDANQPNWLPAIKNTTKLPPSNFIPIFFI